MQSANDLKQLLFSINHKSYPAYKSTRGAYQFPRYTLSIDHVQGDPFAAPSRVSVHVSGKTAAFPAFLYDTYEKRVALQDYLLRQFARAIAPYSFRAKGSGKSGLLGISRCGQEILERTACVLNPSDGSLIVNMEIGFPANGRTIASQELIRILFDFLPGCVEKSLFYRALDPKACANVAYLCEDQQAIRSALKEKGLTAFIADGSILPRETGVSDLPMKHAVPFTSPESLRVTLDLPNRGPVSGMGIQNFDFHFVTWLCNGVKIDGRIVGIFVFGKNTIGFVSDIQDNLIVFDIDYSTLNDFSVSDCFK